MMLQEMIIVGSKPSKGEMEGRSYDSTKIYIQTKFDSNGRGFATTEYNWGNSTNFDKIKDLQYPFNAQVTLEMVTTGKTQRIIVTDVQPIKPKV